MLSKLIVHPEPNKQQQWALEVLDNLQMTRKHPDLLWLEPKEDKSLGVKEAKQVREHFYLKPFSAKGRVALIFQADHLTLDAQNSLLKTLEEAPSEGQLILTSNSEQDLLPTVVSRCEIISGPADNQQGNEAKLQKWSKTIEELLSSSLEHRFEIIEQTEDKEGLLEALTIYIHQGLRTDFKWLRFSKLLIKAKEYQEANGNIRAILEYLMLNL